MIRSAINFFIPTIDEYERAQSLAVIYLFESPSPYDPRGSWWW